MASDGGERETNRSIAVCLEPFFHGRIRWGALREQFMALIYHAQR